MGVREIKKRDNSGGLCEKGVMCFRVMGDVVGKVLNTKDDPIRMPINRHPLAIQKDANLGTMVKGLYRWK